MQPLPNAVTELLTPEECAQIDQTLLPTRDRFAMRIAIYAWRYLHQVSGRLEIPMAHLTPDQIGAALQSDPSLEAEPGMDAAFLDWFARLLTSALGSLTQIATATNTPLEQLSFDQIVAWFVGQFHGTP